MLEKVIDLIRETKKTVCRWTTFPIASYQYARGYGRSRVESVKFAMNMAGGCQWEDWKEWK